MTPPVKCTGPPAPAWMATVESIDTAAALLRQKVPSLMERTGSVVVGTTMGEENVSLTDRSTGVVYHWLPGVREPGEIATTYTKCASRGEPDHQWDVHMRILRRAKIAEVRKMAKKWGGATPLKLRAGLWYSVITD